METLSTAIAFGGTQGVYRHASATTGTAMTFAVYTPPGDGPFPVLWYLSGLTCSHQNVMDKGEYRRMAAELGLMIVCPDTSPRGGDVMAHDDDWQLGCGAGFYLDATTPGYQHFQMYSYLTDELPALLGAYFADADLSRQGIFGHSMGGHGALTLALKNPERFKSCSAFAPIVHPSTADWSSKALRTYLGDDPAHWRAYDAISLIEDGHRFDAFLVDQGEADSFLHDGLRPWLFQDACESTGQDLTLRMQPGYDHSYFFISTFMDDHLHWHAQRLG
ncbi:S-formylglutathione hydrolase [Litorivicinus lipolyticus]|uniref:S-formylglutathione hydrolase n=1 Tax=Litorivicinus lipolyticus TaxID=418701 RepID=A0A5Q2QEH8_9GAMM|nr:S-formylglutathione hydrolase [Litorivicinus lipolyticus]QGG80407.1 S-formylglutathione hydrolase [Litorivicinus lipolyticus]